MKEIFREYVWFILGLILVFVGGLCTAVNLNMLHETKALYKSLNQMLENLDIEQINLNGTYTIETNNNGIILRKIIGGKE